MQTPFERWTDYFLPDGREVSVEELKKYRILVFVCFLTSVLAFGYLVFSVVIGFRVGIYTMAFSSVVMPGLPFALKRGANRVAVANIYVGIIFMNTVLITSFSGGLSTSITSPYIAIVPMLGVMLINQKAGFIWFFVVIAEILLLGIAQIAGVDFPITFDPDVDAAFKLAAFLGLVVIVFFIVRDFDSRAEMALQRVEEEQQKTQNLLLNILPEEVAEELKATGRAEAREFERVTILFSDFQNFTEISADMTPQDLVAELNTCFYAFDAIMKEHDIEKIKTIGDAYMAASGLAVANSEPPANMVRAALDMQAFLVQHGKDNSDRGTPAFSMRAGIHTGPVVAGVVGETKFQYDVWGDTVNTASRMETSGEVGEVNISEATYALVKNEPGFTFTPRGKVDVKGKGELEMYFVRAD
jgi:class 3 adenylate cyclase